MFMKSFNNLPKACIVMKCMQKKETIVYLLGRDEKEI